MVQPPKFDAATRKRLEAFLASERGGQPLPSLPWLDGFVTAVAIGPDLLMPSEWLPAVWEDEEPEFKDEAEAEAVYLAIMGRYNQILEQLDEGFESFTPILGERDGTVEGARDWSEGFRDGVRLNPDVWEPLFDDEEGRMTFSLLVALCSDDSGANVLGATEDSVQRIGEKAAEYIPGSVATIQDFWLARAATEGLETPPAGSGQPRRVEKVGRNEPCPCGSGKKYKRCCGAN